MKLDIDFKKHILDGSAVLDIEKVDPNATQVILDSRAITIKSIVDDATGQKLEFKLHEEDYVGSKLEVQLPNSKDKK